MSEEFNHDIAEAEHRVDEIDPPRLFGPERLNAEEASRLLSRGPGRLVVWVGEERHHTTALTAALYESQRRERGETRFAGSWTLLALEALIGHGPAPPERHDDDGREVLHLALSVNGEATHLLFAELPDEEFRRLADNEVSADDGPWLRRADRIAFVVDGDQIRAPTSRAMVLTRVRQLVERLRARELPDQSCRLALVVVNWDLVEEDLVARGYWGSREPELLADLRTLDAEAPAMHVSNGRDRDDHGIATVRAWLLGAAPPVLGAPLGPLVPDSVEPLEWSEPLAVEPWHEAETLHEPEPLHAADPPPPDRPRPPEDLDPWDRPDTRDAPPTPDERRPFEEHHHGHGRNDDEWLYGPPPRLRLPWRRRR